MQSLQSKMAIRCQGGCIVISVKAKIENQWQKGNINNDQFEFETIAELENFLAYNRAYIRTISFKGSIKVGA